MWDIPIIGLAVVASVMVAYWAFISNESCTAYLDRSLDTLFASHVGRLASVWVRVSQKVRFVPATVILALIFILVPWFAFPYAGYHRFDYLTGGASLASGAGFAGWWTWALARQYRGRHRILSLGTACGFLYLLGLLEGTVGYYYWVFCRGYFLDFPPTCTG